MELSNFIIPEHIILIFVHISISGVRRRIAPATTKVAAGDGSVAGKRRTDRSTRKTHTTNGRSNIRSSAGGDYNKF